MIIKRYIGLHMNYPLFFVRLQWNLNFLDTVMKHIQIPNFNKIRLVVTELFHAEGQTGVTKLKVGFAILRASIQGLRLRTIIKYTSTSACLSPRP